MRAKGISIPVGLLAAIGIGAAQGQVAIPALIEPKASHEVGGEIDYKNDPNFRVVESRIPAPVEYEFSRTVGPGRLKTVRAGKPGRIEKIYRVHFKNGKPASKTLLKTHKVAPESKLIYMGRSGFSASRHSFTRSRVVTMHASAYDPSAGRGSRATFRTSTGLKAQYGVVATDPRVIPMGTKLFVEGYGFAVAADKGSAIKGNRIDLCFPTRAQCFEFGRKKVTVHILK
ncbi:MAG TPA: 3D domain-containing protein [Fimbriimonadaceae bacterium]|nr:3D domain-containing protein [Fimbriimonadaceae bacterium]